MRRRVAHALVVVVALAGAVVALGPSGGPVRAADRQRESRDPNIGYVYPAGGQQGTTVHVTAGGQRMQGVTGVHVTGGGVDATLIRYEGRVPQLNGDERRELKARLTELRRRKQAEAAGAEPPPASRRTPAASGKPPTDKPAPDKPPTELPKHPLLNVLDELSLEELDRLEVRFLHQDQRRQPNVQIGETAFLEVRIAPDARPGDRDLRLVTRAGLSNPMRFQVGALPEAREPELLGERSKAPPPLDTPVLLNGQILPGEVDRFRLRARAGQRLVVQTHARRLVPYLADAVPGWFQATVALLDERGVEVAFADDWRFDPDPVLCCEIPRDGEYSLQIHDAIYRGREDFVYRVRVAEGPFVTGMFPLGAREGEAAVAAVDGWNLSVDEVLLDTDAGGEAVRRTSAGAALERTSNELAYAVDALPESAEDEAAEATAAAAQPIAMPRIVNGRIGWPGDVDVFEFRGHQGEEIVAEVVARRLGSPLDALLRLVDASGEVVAWNDDHVDRASGLLTHHADAYLRVRLPIGGVYRVQLSDAQRHGGDEYAYRLRVSKPRPDFAAFATPASLNVAAGGAVPFDVHVVRRDGFDGEIQLALIGAPPGFALNGGRVPAGRDHVLLTLSAPPIAVPAPLVLHLEARARAGDAEIVRRVVPAEDAMQAFAYRHLAPAQDLLLSVIGAGRLAPQVDLPPGAVEIPSGGSATLHLGTRRNRVPDTIRFDLLGAPDGLTLGEVTMAVGVVNVTLNAADTLPPGTTDNVVLEVIYETPARPAAGDQPARARQRTSIGYLPAIRFEVVGARPR